jgi:Icc-related predicted phosphoesterase
LVRILAFTDAHGKLEVFQDLKRLAESTPPEVFVCAGDLSFFGDGYDLFLRGLGALGQPVYFVPGNHETPSTVKSLEIQFPYLRNVAFQVVEAAGIRLAGLPASDAFWPGAQPDEVLCARGAAMGEAGDRKKPLVLLTHYPPSGTRVSGVSVLTLDSGGSRLVRRIVEALRPALVVCGHYHQDFGKEAHVGETRIVNPGPGGRILEVEP